jgi:hypothetical protein
MTNDPPLIDPEVRPPLDWMHGHLAGTFSFDENIMPMKVVVDHEGRLVSPVMVAMLTSEQTVLYLPDEGESTLHIMVTLEQFDENGTDGHLADRWRIYHGEPDDVRWAIMHIEAARLDGVFYDGDGLLVPNALGGVEANICRWANEELVDGLRAACLREREIEIKEPRLVGVDPLGFDVRGRFDVVRLDSPTVMTTEQDARLVLGKKTAS